MADMPAGALRDSLLRDLVSAASEGDMDAVCRLLSLGLPVDFVDQRTGLSPLHAAAGAGQVEVMTVLLQRCSDPDSPQIGGVTPLAHAVHELAEPSDPTIPPARRLQTLRILLNAGAKPAAGGPGQEPIGLARLYGLASVETLLREHHVEPPCGHDEHTQDFDG